MEVTAQALIDYDLTDWYLLSGGRTTITATLKGLTTRNKIVLSGLSMHLDVLKYDFKFSNDS